MRARGTVILLALVLALGAYILFHESSQGSSDEKRIASRRAFQIDPSLVTSLAIQVPAYSVELKREGDQWRLTQPKGAPAHVPMIRQTLSKLQHVDRGELITPADMRERGLTLADFGLAVPGARLRIGTASGMREYQIGNPDPLGTSLYVKERESQNVMLVNVDLLSVIPPDRDGFRDRRLFTLEPKDVVLLSLVTPERKLSVERGPAAWTLLDPLRAEADQEQVRLTLEKIQLARVDSFVDTLPSDLGLLGLETPRASIRMQASAEGVPQELWIGNPLPGDPDKRYARNPRHDGVLVVSAGLANLAAMEEEALRERRLFTEATPPVSSITISRPLGDLVLRKQADDSWTLVAAAELAASSERVQEFLDVWRNARVEQFLRGTAMVDVAWSVSFATNPPQPEGPLRFDVLAEPHPPGRIAIRRHGSAEILLVVPDILKTFPLTALHFRSPGILRFDPRQVIRVSVVAGGVTSTVTRVSPADPWASAGPEQEAVAANLETLLSTLSTLDARQWLGDDSRDATAIALREPILRLSIGVDGTPPMSRTLLLGEPEGSGEILGRLQGQDLVFSLDALQGETLRLPICQPRAATDALLPQRP